MKTRGSRSISSHSPCRSASRYVTSAIRDSGTSGGARRAESRTRRRVRRPAAGAAPRHRRRSPRRSRRARARRCPQVLLLGPTVVEQLFHVAVDGIVFPGPRLELVLRHIVLIIVLRVALASVRLHF